MGRSGSDSLNQAPPLAYETYDNENFQATEALPHAPPSSEPPQLTFQQQPPQVAYNNLNTPPAQAPHAIQAPPYPQQENASPAVQFPPPNPQAPAPGAAAYGQYPPQGVNLPQKPNNGSPKPGYASGIPVTHPPGNQGSWSSGLFDCMQNPDNAIATAFFPCVTFGQIAEIIDNGQNTCMVSGFIYSCAMYIGLPWIMSCSYRTKLRSRYDLMELPAQDWMIHLMCGCCALCQEYRELQHRGFDPSIGWLGNMEKVQRMQQQAAPGMTPPMNQTMMSG